MESRNGTKTEAIAELRKVRALIDEVVGNLRRQMQIVYEETDEAKRLKLRKQISKDQDEFMECMKQIQSIIREFGGGR